MLKFIVRLRTNATTQYTMDLLLKKIFSQQNTLDRFMVEYFFFTGNIRLIFFNE